MKMIEFVIGAAAGAAAVWVALKSTQNNQTNSSEKERLYEENNKIAGRNREMEDQIADLLSTLDKERRRIKELETESEEFEDERDTARRELKALSKKEAEQADQLRESHRIQEILEHENEYLKKQLEKEA